MPTSARTAGLTLALAIAASALTACGDFEIEEPQGFSCPVEHAPLALVVGARANSPMQGLPENVEHLVRFTLASGAPVSVIPVDGNPRIAFVSQVDDTDVTDSKLEHDLQLVFNDFKARYGSETLALTPEADPLAAIAAAAREIPSGGTVVVLDSGIQTVAPLDFTQDGFIAAEAPELVSGLDDGGYLPDLEGRNVVFAGLGDTVPPQEKPAPLFRDNLIDIWTAIAEASGACVEVIEQSQGDEPVQNEDLPTVSTAPMPSPEVEIDLCGETVFDSTSPVRFQPSSPEFIDRNAAEQALSEIAQVMIQENRSAELIGTTAMAGTAEGRQTLSEERAEAVKAVLIDLGVPADRITTKGVGAEWPGREDDIGPNDDLVEPQASHNRSVIVQLYCE